MPEQALKALGFVLEKHANAVLPDGLDELKAALRQAIRVLRDRQGIIRVGAGRLRVKQKIEALRSPDGTWPAEHRLLKRATFDAWCAEEGGKVSSPDALLTWLHNSGTVFHPRELLQDQIVLDHTWALNAIYAVFDRTSCYPRLVRETAFRQRVRAYHLPDGDISSFVRRREIQKYWATQHQTMKDASEGADDLSTSDQDELRRTGHIARHASDILSLIKDTIGIRDIDELIRVEFPDEPPPSG